MTRKVTPFPRALVVDDGPLNRRLMQALLEQMGCVVDTAASGEEALLKCAAQPYDVAFVDLHMPGIGGREMIGALRESEYEMQTPRVPVVVLTADDAPPSGDQSWFDLFVSKPITSALLKASFDVLAAHGSEQPTVVAVPKPLDAIDELITATSDALHRMKQSFAVGDYEAIVAEAYVLKGCGGAFGFHAMSAHGDKLEQAAKAQSQDRVERGLLELERSLSYV